MANKQSFDEPTDFKKTLDVTIPVPFTGQEPHVFDISTADKNKFIWAKWRWEFLRRNSKFRQNIFEAAKVIQDILPDSPFHEIKKEDPNKFLEELFKYPWWLILQKPEPNIICELYEKWEIWIILPPDKSLDQIFESLEQESDTSLPPRIPKALIIDYILPSVIKTVRRGDIPRSTDLAQGRLVLEIDFTKFNSPASLMKEVNYSLETFLGASKYQFAFIPPDEEGDRIAENIIEVETGARRYKVDYDLLLQIGDMKEKDGLTYQEVAKEINLRKYEVNPQSATRLAGQLYQRYKDLVNGGYKYITYP
jgi:hypothetical protein